MVAAVVFRSFIAREISLYCLVIKLNVRFVDVHHCPTALTAKLYLKQWNHSLKVFWENSCLPLSLSISWKTSLHTAANSSSFDFWPSKNTKKKGIFKKKVTIQFWRSTHQFSAPHPPSHGGSWGTWATRVRQNSREDQEASTLLNCQSKSQ